MATDAASMVTIASVTLSITIVGLQLASSQFGPRLLSSFMHNRGNQIEIGTFIVMFSYCLLASAPLTHRGITRHFVPRRRLFIEPAKARLSTRSIARLRLTIRNCSPPTR